MMNMRFKMTVPGGDRSDLPGDGDPRFTGGQTRGARCRADDAAVLEDLSRRSFQFFWDKGDPSDGNRS